MPAQFNRLHPPSLRDTCTHEILGKILSGELQPGDKLPSERDLSEMLGVSRTIVNQALSELDSMGFVDAQPRKAAVVCDFKKSPTPQSLAVVMSYQSSQLDETLFVDMMGFHLLLEMGSARLACEHIFPETLEEMRQLLDGIEVANDPIDLIYQFHYHLTRASGNTIYAMFFRACEPLTKALIRQHVQLRAADTLETNAHRRALVDAIATNQPDLAVRLIREILIQHIPLLEEKFSKYEPQTGRS